MIESVKLIECPRDAWQGLQRYIPTERKVEYLRGLVSAGFRHIDAVSFVSAKAVPQMADSEQVLKQLGPLEDVEIIGIVVNEKGAERAIATERVSTLGYPYSISETFLRRNQNQSPQENEAVLKRIKARADEGGRRFDAAIDGLGGCPFAQDKLVGNVPTEEVLRALEQRGVKLLVGNRISAVTAMNAAINAEFSIV